MARTRDRSPGTRRPSPRAKAPARTPVRPERSPERPPERASSRAHDRSAEFQDPHTPEAPSAKGLELAIGHEVRHFRRKLDMTVADLAKQSGLSAGMLSKIENGQTSPSLATLQALSMALHVPVTAFFRRFEEERNATYVKAGHGLKIERRGTRAGHQYHLLGHTMRKNLAVEPYLIELLAHSDVFPLFQHDGVEFIYMLEGEVGYRHGSQTYVLKPGDSLFFDADVPHGPDELRKLPIRFISVITYSRGGES